MQDPYYLFAYYYTDILSPSIRGNQMSMNQPHMNEERTQATILYLYPAARDQIWGIVASISLSLLA
jgi:hypothetical protein